MAPFATLYTLTNIVYARIIKALAAAKLNNLDIAIDPNFQYSVTNKTPAYLSKFPHGKIPALETSSGFLLSESTAIALYLAESGPAKDQLIGRTVEERALVQMWISLSDTDLWINGSAILAPIFGRAPYFAEIQEDKAKQFERAVQRVEDEFTRSGKKWLVRDDELSLADLSVAGALYWPLKFFMDAEYRDRFPKVMGWWERLIEVKEVAEAFSAPVELCKVKPAMDGKGGPPDSNLANADKNKK